MNFCLVNSSKVEFWNSYNSFIFIRSCWWTSRKSCCCRNNSSCRILRFCSAWAARSSWWRTFSLHSAIIVLRCSSNHCPNLCFRAFHAPQRSFLQQTSQFDWSFFWVEPGSTAWWRPQRDCSSVWKIGCPMRTCDGDDQVHHAHLSNIAHNLPRTGVKKKAMEWTTKTQAMEPIETSGEFVWLFDTLTRERNKNVFAHTARKRKDLARDVAGKTWSWTIHAHLQRSTPGASAADRPPQWLPVHKGWSKNQQIKPNQCDCLARLQTEPCSSCAPPTPRTGQAPSRTEAIFARLVIKNVTQKANTNETGPRSSLLPVLSCLVSRTCIKPLGITLTLKEKRHCEVCLERVFTRLAGVGLERLGEEARHRRLRCAW